MAMTCPRCSQNLQTRPEGKAEVDACPDCKGMWLDFGEIETLVDDKDVLQRVFQSGLINPGPSPLTCPKCGTSLKLLKGGLASPVLLVDQCSNCMGIWLDGNELRLLEKVLEAAKSPRT